MRKIDALGHAIGIDDEELERSGLTVSDLTARLAGYLTSDRVPYVARVLKMNFPGSDVGDSAFGNSARKPRTNNLCLVELIWCYWLEEAGLVRTLDAVSHRFQNMRAAGDRDPLANLDIDPLRPLNNLLWGYIQDEKNRLTPARRALEYDHQYGLTLSGVARPPGLIAARGFSKPCTICCASRSNSTGRMPTAPSVADGFPLLFALREVHLLLAEGAHNQFGDLPMAARAEMMLQQWLSARPEMRDFLRARAMVPYTRNLDAAGRCDEDVARLVQCERYSFS